MTLNLWQTIKNNIPAISITGLAASTAGSLFSYAASSINNAEQHLETEQWAAWMAANLTEALRIGNTTYVVYVIQKMEEMQEHCVNSAADEYSKATVQNIFASAFLIGAALYGGVQAYKALTAPQQGYSPVVN